MIFESERRVPPLAILSYDISETLSLAFERVVVIAAVSVVLPCEM